MSTNQPVVDEPLPLFSQLYGYSPRRMSLFDFAQKEMNCLDMIRAALTAFVEGQLYEFDPFVGDSSCQWSTHKAIELYLEDGFREANRQVLDRIDLVKQQLERFQDKEPRQLKRILSQSEIPALLLQLTKDQTFLTNCYVLKRITRNSDSFYEGLLAAIAGSKGIEKTRKAINRANQDHIWTVAQATHSHWIQQEQLPLARKVEELCEILEPMEKHDQFHLRAAYPGMKILEHRLWQQGSPVLMKAFVLFKDHMHVIVRLFSPNPGKVLQFNPVPQTQFAAYLQKPVMVVWGLTDFNNDFHGIEAPAFYQRIASTPRGTDHCCDQQIRSLTEKFDSLGVMTILCAHTTTRWQYYQKERPTFYEIAGHLSSSLLSEFENHKNLAIRFGLCEADASCYRPVHSFPDLMAHAIANE